jgi:hypothetical protein
MQSHACATVRKANLNQNNMYQIARNLLVLCYAYSGLL